MKLVKSLLLGTAAGLATVAGAQAADLPARNAAPVEYVRVCSTYGAGFFLHLGYGYNASGSAAVSATNSGCRRPTCATTTRQGCAGWAGSTRMPALPPSMASCGPL